jgi:hypothetical protein
MQHNLCTFQRLGGCLEDFTLDRVEGHKKENKRANNSEKAFWNEPSATAK